MSEIVDAGKEKLQRVLANCLRVAYSDLTKTTSRTIPWPSPDIMPPDEPIWRLDVEGWESVTKALEALNQDPRLSSYYSESKFLTAINEALSKMLETSPNIISRSEILATEALKHLFDGLESPSIFQVVIPITGIRVTGPPLPLGRVTVVASVEEALDRLGKTGMKKAGSVELLLTETCASLEVSGSDEKKAGKTAIERVGTLLNSFLLYRYGLSYRGLSKIKPFAGMKRANWAEPITVIIFGTNGAILSWENGDLVLPDVVNAAFLQIYDAEGFPLLCNILAKNDWERTEMENILLIAMDFCVGGFLAELDIQKIVNFAISLEVLFRPTQKAEGVAQSVVQIIKCDNYKGINPPVHDFVKKAFEVRNRIVHAGKPSPEDFNVIRLGRLCARCIIQAIKSIGSFKTWDEFSVALTSGRLEWQNLEDDRSENFTFGEDDQISR